MKQTLAIVAASLAHGIDQKLMRSCIRAIDRRRFNVVLIVTGYLAKDADFNPGLLIPHYLAAQIGVGGVLIFSDVGFEASDQQVANLLKCYEGIPVVALGNEMPGICSVGIDNATGIKSLVGHLYAQGCRNIGFVKGPEDNHDARERYAAFCEAMAEKSLAIEEHYVLPGNYSSLSARLAIQALSAKKIGLPDAFMCANDLMAKGAIEEFIEQGVRVPEDILVTGFDDFEYSQVMEPTLTSVTVPFGQIAEQGVARLVRKLEGEAQVESAKIASLAILRASSGIPKEQVAHIPNESNRWVLLQHQDLGDGRYTVERLLRYRSSFKKTVHRLKPVLHDIGLAPVYFYRTMDQEQHQGGWEKIRLVYSSTDAVAEEKDTPVPSALFSQDVSDHDSVWTLCPMFTPTHNFGYIAARAKLSVAGFVESLAMYMTDNINAGRLQAVADEMRDYAQEAESMATLGELVASVTHEVNTPLGVSILAITNQMDSVREIDNLLQTSKLRKPDFDQFLDQCRETSDIIGNSLERVRELLTHFREVAVDQSSDHSRTLDVGEYIQTVMHSLKPKFKRSNVKVRLELLPGIILTTYPGALAQVITNFAMNAYIHAFDNGKQEGTFSIRMAHDGDILVLTFEDNGAGMDEPVLTQAFEKYFTTQRGKGGSGLGLFIVNQLINDQLGGKIKATSSPEEGSRFVVSLVI